MTHEDHVWVEYIDVPDCWALLARAPVGRVGVLVDSAPEIYPVNHAVDDHTIVFRTDDGSKLRGLDRSPSVCYEVDGVDVDRRTGWSVLVKGRALVLRGTDAEGELTRLGLRPWSPGSKPCWIRIVPSEVTGRRLSRV